MHTIMHTMTLSMSTPEAHGVISPPYAGPALQVAPRADGSAAGQVRSPYVPPALRSGPSGMPIESVEHSSASAPLSAIASVAAGEYRAQAHDSSEFYTPPFLEALPAIGEFLRSTPVGRIEAVHTNSPETAEPAEPVRPEDWPFAEAGAETTELSAEFRPIGHEQLFADVPEPSPLPMWNDDDLMDIMPTPEAERPAEETPHWTLSGADASVEESLQSTNSESAARALEALAARVRSGELRIEGYAPELGDAAALAAALAALLGIRR